MTCNVPSSAGGMDFLPINELLRFEPNQQRRCVIISILNDQECEEQPNEMFTVVVRGEDQRAVLRPSTSTITIDDRGQFTTVTDPDCCKLQNDIAIEHFTINNPYVNVDISFSYSLRFSSAKYSLPLC